MRTPFKVLKVLKVLIVACFLSILSFNALAHNKVVVIPLSSDRLIPAGGYTFTLGGSTGIHGPTQVQIDTTYAGAFLEGTVTINTRGIQEWTVPLTGSYQIEAFGAAGADSGALGAGIAGRGARMC